MITKIGYLDPKNFKWIDDLSLLYDLRFYGRVLSGDYKGIFNKHILYIFKILVLLIKLRFKYSFWYFRFEAKIFYFANGVIQHFPKIRDFFKIPTNI